MDSKLAEVMQNTNKVVKKDKKEQEIAEKAINEYKNSKVRKFKSFLFSALMFAFGASCILNFYQYPSFVEPFLSPVK